MGLEFEEVISLLVIVAFAFMYFRHKEQKPKEEILREDVTIKERSEESVGFYNDSKICKFVVLTTGEKFEFVSLAVEVSPGLFASDLPDIQHICIDGCLLYRLVV